ncbi:hypothetical protein EDB95_5472 [Dinghuibacter silviterrae]|uniref:DUF3575 domain-containing protein n=2 Tax=Dinghuibacter silviterrae TaxID=1539049 RepID=A0A4R8DIP2_9BACT|nr:hypothetical protein EDB95_5472 [Dinghuibacter silviterrae]
MDTFDSLFNGFWPRLPDRYISVYIEPLATLDPNGGSLRAGVEWAWNRRWSIYSGGGLYFDQGYMARVGLKRSFRGNGPDRYSIALDLMHNWHTRTEEDYYPKYDSSIHDETEDYSRPVHYPVEKDVSTVSLLFCWDKSFWRYFTLSLYSGVGVKFRKAVVGISQDIQDSLYHYTYGGGYIVPLEDSRGNGVMPELMAGFTVGWLFAKRERD